MEECRSVFKMLTRKLTMKIPLGRPWLRCEDKARMDLIEMNVNRRNLIDSAQGRDYWGAGLL
jgi:hypothetical protein